jgi:chemotaxis protein MotB
MLWAMARPPSDPSGVMVYPKMPSPKNRPSDQGLNVRGFDNGGGDSKKKWILIAAGAAVVGGLIGFLVRPTHGDEADKAKQDLAAAQKATTAEKSRADGLDKSLTDAKKEKDDLDAKYKEVSGKAADVDKKMAEADALQKKLQGAIDKNSGSVSAEGDEIHLKLVDKVLFAVGDDQLTDNGKKVLDKVVAALKEFPDKQIWVQGHTDDQPIFVPPVKKDPKDKKVKGKEKEKEKVEPGPVRFITNWELSAARALNVVHYLQDTAKVDPTRLAALAFGQYRPVSRTNKAANRRIEIVLYPKRVLASK